MKTYTVAFVLYWVEKSFYYTRRQKAREAIFSFFFLYSANKLCKFFFNLHLFSGADQLKDQYTYILTRIESEVPIYIIPRDFKVLSFAQYKALK